MKGKNRTVPLYSCLLYNDGVSRYRPFSVQKVPHSNLILLVVDTTCPCGSKQLSIAPQEIVYNNGNAGCLHQIKDSLYRRRPPKCFNYHPEVSISVVIRFLLIALQFAGNRDPRVWNGFVGVSQFDYSVCRSVILCFSPSVVISVSS